MSSSGFRMEVSIRKVKDNPNMFEFVISTPTLTSQFRLPRMLVNKLRILIEKALVDKPKVS
ncbi:MAG: hypothetical protein KKF54_07920 [Candidatus Omnitrophica bacterium]|nr:hypothetical protein [Candidatus Omnitrophota bacterium]